MVKSRATVGFNGQAGFSMVEMLIALALFVTSIIGIGSMLMQGAVGVNASASRNKASRLANARIEEIKSSPFYVQWSGTDRDIDDIYYDESYSNEEQFAHPTVENPVAGAVGYRRTTAVQYVYVREQAGVRSLAPATMYNQANGRWVPSNPDNDANPRTFDLPKGGATAAVDEKLHGLMIEVKVFFYENGVQQSVVQHAVVGDLLTPGGSTGMDPILVVTGITPNESFCGAGYADVPVSISVNAPQMEVGDVVKVQLWQPNTSQKINATGVAVAARGGPITAHFNLTNVPSIGVYNLSVNWVTRGFMDNNFRNCFTIKAPPIQITNVYTINDQNGGPNNHHAWGYSGMGARRIWVTGQNIYWNPSLNLVLEKSGQSTLTGSSLTCAADGTWAYADFNLSTAATGLWDFSCDSGTAGKTTRAQCMEMNPAASIYEIEMRDGKYSYGYRDDAGTRPVRVNGTGLYGNCTGLLRRAGLNDCPASLAYAASGDNIRWSDCNYADFNVNITGAAAQRPNNSDWAVHVANHAGSAASISGVWDGANPDYAFRINPAPSITSSANINGTYTGTGPNGGNPGRTLTGISVAGKYLQPSMSMYAVRSAAAPVNGNTYCDLTGGVRASEASITSMTMNVSVNPMIAASFKVWGTGSVQSDNGSIGGSYRIYYVGRDGQACLSPAVTVNHNLYSINSTSSPSGWGSVTGGGNYYQDQAWTLNPNPVSSAGNYMGSLRTWQEPPGTDQWDAYPWTLTGTAIANRSLNCRFCKWFYYGDDTAAPNKASFVQSVNDSPYDNIQTAGVEGAYRVLWVKSKANYSLFGSDTGEVGARTTNQVSYAGATTLYWYSAQADGNNNGVSNRSYICSSAGANDRWNVGSMWGTDDTYDYAWRAMSVSGRANGYLHVNSQTDASILGGNSTCTRVRYIFME